MDLEEKRNKLAEIKKQRADLEEELSLEQELDTATKLLEKEKKRLSDLKFKNSFLGRFIK